MSVLDEMPDGPRDVRHPWKTWATVVITQLRDNALTQLAKNRDAGWPYHHYEVLVRMYERELERRRVNPKVYDQACEFGPYEVVADAEDLSA